MKQVTTEASTPGMGGIWRFSLRRRATEMEDDGHMARFGPFSPCRV
jgi:hypothetical protein